MDFEEYRKHGKEMVDFIADYLENIRDRRVFPNVKPGYMRHLLEDSAPLEGEEWSKIFDDIERVIMPGITHWQSPHMHAYFPALNSGPSLLGDMLADAINCLGFTWASSPACTELETIVMNWLGKMIGLPDDYLNIGKNSKGGGAIQTTASEATLVCLLAGRTQAIRRFHEQTPGHQDSEINARLVAYCSDQAHSSVEKAALIGLVRMRYIESDENLTLRGAALREAIEDDIKLGLIPFWVCATLGTTGACSFDNLEEIADVCIEQKIWLHVDAAYAGSAFICPEYRTWLKGIEKADSIAFNPSKWLMVHFDCTAMWVKNSGALHRTFNVEPLYLQHENSGLAIDYMHWQIPLSKRFRALKLWFVIRNYGIKGLQKHIREGVRLAKKIEALILADHRFEIPAVRHLGLVVFRIKGENNLTERLLKRLNHRGNLHCVPASLKGKYVIRFTITSTHTTNDDLLTDWAEIRSVTTEILEELNVKIGDRVKVPLKDTREKNEAFGSSLLLANSPMSPKIVNGSFAAIFDTDEFLSKAYAGIRIASQNSPAMRRRVRGILMSGKQFSLDSRMDLVCHGMDSGSRKTSNSAEENRAITEDNEEGWEACEVNSAESDYATENQTSTTPKQETVSVAHQAHNSTSSEDEEQQLLSKSLSYRQSSASNFLTVTAFDSEICTDLRKTIQSPLRPRVPKRNRIDFGIIDGKLISSLLPEKRQSDPQIRYAFYNKGFEVAASCRKFSLTQIELKRSAMPDITENGSIEDEYASIEQTIANRELTNVFTHGSSGQDITLLPKLKIRICDEMGKRINSSFDENPASPDERKTVSNHCKATDVLVNQNKCIHKTNEDPFNGDKQKVNENFRKCKKCGHYSTHNQFKNSFYVE